MVVIGLGANLPDDAGRAPRATLEAALAALAGVGLYTVRRSRWYRSAPVPPSEQPWYVNGVALVSASGGAVETLDALHGLERRFGRVRGGVPNAPRVLDLDLLDYHGLVRGGLVRGGMAGDGEEAPTLPHPRMAGRAFVILPLAELAPGWRHPVLGVTAAALAARLPAGQTALPIEEEAGE